MERSPQIVLLPLAALVAVWISACGGDGGNEKPTPAKARTTTETEKVAYLDTAKLESLLKKLLSGTSLAPTINGQPTKASKKVTFVRCPERVVQEKGATFACRVRAIDTSEVAGKVPQAGAVTLTQRDDEGKLLTYKAELKGGAVDTTQRGKLPLK